VITPENLILENLQAMRNELKGFRNRYEQDKALSLEALAYDKHFRDGVQAALDDPRPLLSHEEVMAASRARIDAIAREKSVKHAA